MFPWWYKANEMLRKCHTQEEISQVHLPKRKRKRKENFKLVINGLFFSMTGIIFRSLLSYLLCLHFMDLTFTRLFQRQSWRQLLCTSHPTDAHTSHIKLLDLSMPLHSSSRVHPKTLQAISKKFSWAVSVESSDSRCYYFFKVHSASNEIVCVCQQIMGLYLYVIVFSAT